jgi:hypothetical protein
MRAFADLLARADAVAKRLRPEQADAFFELVGYPVAGSALANERFFAGEQSARVGEPEKARWLTRAQAADAELRQLTDHYNNAVAGGKWRGLMNVEPADDQWKSFRLVRWEPPKDRIAADEPPKVHAIAKEAEHFTRKTARGGASWEIIPGLGRTGEGSVAVFPTTMASIASDKLATDAPRLDYDMSFAEAGKFSVAFYLIPTQALAGDALRFAFALDDAPPQVVSLKVDDGRPGWVHGVLDATRVANATLNVASPGAHTLRLYAVDAGVVVDKIVVDLGGTTPSYLGPPENSSSP